MHHAAHPASWTVGELTVHRVEETPLPAPTGAWLLPDATPELVTAVPWLTPDLADADGALRLHSHSFVVRAGDTTVLVDTGIGNGKDRANPAWHDLDTGYLGHLADLGLAPSDIDLVVLTHLHTDHVGWNTTRRDGRWVPTFVNARHLTTRVEREFWAGYAMEPARQQMFEDSVLPVQEAGLLDLLDVPAAGLEVVPGLRLLPTPGHTPGHVSVQLTSQGERALITGDCVHHPVQLPHPDITSCVDIDPALARTTRRRVLAEAARHRTLVLGSHFPSPTAGRVQPAGDGTYRLEPEPGT